MRIAALALVTVLGCDATRADARAPSVDELIAKTFRIDPSSAPVEAEDGFHVAVGRLRRPEALLPRTADGVVRLSSRSASPSDRATVTLRPLDLAPVHGHGDAFGLRYEQAAVGTDVRWLVAPDGIEEVRVLDSAAASPRARYELGLEGVLVDARVRDGEVQLLDAAGRVRIATAAPWAIDSKGTRRTVSIELAKSAENRFTLTLSVDVAGLVHPVLLDPLWTLRASMSTPRREHAATLLADGRVMVTGGVASSTVFDSVSSTEIYDAKTDSWTTAAPMKNARSDHGAVLLPDGRLFVAGGFASFSSTPLSSAEIYDPKTDKWTSAAPLAAARGFPELAMAPSGSVLAIGGEIALSALSTVERYDVAGDRWDPATALKYGRTRFTLTPLGDGTVLLVGSATTSGPPNERLDLATSTSKIIAGVPGGPRWGHTANRLPSGKVLVVGGQEPSTDAVYDDAYLFDPATETWSTLPKIGRGATNHASVPLSDGSVAIVSGTTSHDSMGAIGTSEIDRWDGTKWSIFGGLTVEHAFSRVVTLSDGSSLLIGGLVPPGKPSDSTDLFLGRLLVGGEVCAQPTDCTSGFCVDGVCCDSACTASCEACDVAGKVGTCSAVTGPRRVGHPVCDSGSRLCEAGTCAAGCTTGADCDFGHYCAAGKCVVGKADGTACSRSVECKSGACVDGVCCESSCDGACQYCAQEGMAGKCVGIDGAPRKVGATCAPFVCGGGACLTKCASKTDCVAGDDCLAGTCAPAITHCSDDRLSTIATDGTRTSCGAYLCRSDGSCGATCTETSDCAPLHVCDTASKTCSRAAPSDDGGGGCAMGRPGSAGFGAFLLLLLLGRMRRAR
ncbi:MAG: kelch repeat-containing protein [Polyangiales bacterium]